MSVSTEIERLQTAKADIKKVLIEKGVTVDDDLKIDGYAALIDEYLIKKS